MRKFQLTINLDCFNTPNKKKTFRVYADANNVWEAICSGLHRLIYNLNREGYMLPFYGAISSSTEEDSL